MDPRQPAQDPKSFYSRPSDAEKRPPPLKKQAAFSDKQEPGFKRQDALGQPADFDEQRDAVGGYPPPARDAQQYGQSRGAGGFYSKPGDAFNQPQGPTDPYALPPAKDSYAPAPGARDQYAQPPRDASPGAQGREQFPRSPQAQKRDPYPAQGREPYQQDRGDAYPSQTRDQYPPPSTQGREPYPPQGRDQYQAPPSTQGRGDPYPPQGRDQYQAPPTQGRDPYPPQARDQYQTPQGRGDPYPPQGRDQYQAPPTQGREPYPPQAQYPPQGRDPYQQGREPQAQGRNQYPPGPGRDDYPPRTQGNPPAQNQPYIAPPPTNQPVQPQSEGYLQKQGGYPSGPGAQGYAPGPSGYAPAPQQGYGLQNAPGPQQGGYAPGYQGGYPPPQGPNQPPAYGQSGRAPYQQDPYAPPAGPSGRPGQTQPPIPRGLPAQRVLDEINQKLSTTRFIAVFTDIHRTLMKKAMNIDSEFDQLDPEHLGLVRDLPFKDVLFKKIGVIEAGACSNEEANFISDLFDLHKSGWVHYREFLLKVRNPEYRIGGTALPPKVDEGWKNNIYRLLSAEVEGKKLSLEDIFGRLDTQRRNSVSLADFQRAMSSFARICTPEEAIILADEFDTLHEGTVAYQQFINRVQDSARRKEVKERVLQDLNRFLTEKEVNFEQELRQVDPRDAKKLTKDDTLMLLDRLGYKGSRVDLGTMLAELPMDTTGLIDLRELATRMPKPKVKMTPQQVLEKIKASLMQHQTTLDVVWPEFDKDGDGQLNPVELFAALTKMNITGLSLTEVTSLVQFLDTSLDGKISLEEMSSKLGFKITPPISKMEVRIVDQTLLRLKDVLQNQGKQLLDFFREVDVSQANALTKEQLQHALYGQGITMSPVDMEKLLTELDRNRDNRISYMELKTRFDQAEETGRKTGSESITKVKQAIRGRRVTEVFRVTFDSTTKQKCIPVKEFQQSIEYLHLSLPLGDIEKIVTQLDKNRSGLIPLVNLQVFYDEPIEAMVQTESIKANQQSPSTFSKPVVKQETPGSVPGHWAESHFQEIRDYCARQRQSLSEVLRMYTDEGSDKMTAQQFSNCLTMLTKTMTPQLIERLTREQVRNGQILTREVINLIDGIVSARADTLLDQVKANMERDGLTVDAAFRTDATGWIYRSDLMDGFSRAGVALFPEDAMEIVNALNPEIKRLNITNPAAQKVSKSVLSDRLRLRQASVRPSVEVESKLLEAKLKKGLYDLMVDHVRSKNLNLERDVFLQFDRGGKNLVNVEDFIQVLKRLTDNTIPREQLELVLRDFDPKSGQVRYAPFIKRIEEGSIQKAFCDRIVTRLRSDLTLSSHTIEDICRGVDYDRSGFITYQDLAQVLDRNGLYVDAQELKTLCDVLERNNEGKVSYMDLHRRITRPVNAAAPVFSQGLGAEVPQLRRIESLEWSKDLMRKVRLYLNSRQMSAKDLFRELDKDRNNTLSAFEFQLGLSKMGTQMSEPDVQRIMTELDLNRDGRISLNEFERIIGTLPKEPWADRLTQELRVQIKRGNFDLRVLYTDADQNRDGLLSQEELVRAGQRLSPNVQVQELRRLAEYLDIDKEGQISYPVFCKAFDPESVLDLNLRVKTELESRRIDLLSVFQPLDTSQDRCLPPTTIMDQLKRLGLQITDGELQALLWENVLYRTKDGRVSYSDLMEQLGFTPRAGYPPQQSGGQSSQPPRLGVQSAGRQPYRTPDSPYFGGESNPPQSFAQASNYPAPPRSEPYSRQPQYQGTWAERYYQAIKDYLSRTRSTLKDLFLEFDIDRNNALNQFEFGNLFQRIGIQITEADLKRLFGELDVNREGRVSMQQFEKILGVATVDPSAERTMETINRSIRMSGMQPRDIFERYDLKRDGHLSYTEFERALRDLRVEVSYSDLQQVIKYLDIDHDGRISYSEFMLRIEGSASSKPLNTRVSEHLKSTQLDLLSVLKPYDTLGDGYMRLADLKSALDRLRFPLTLEEINTLTSQTGVRRREDGRISYTDLLEKLGFSAIPAASSAAQAILKVKTHWNTNKILGEKLFLKYDFQNDQYVSPQSFFEALTYLNCPISRPEVDLIAGELLKLPDGRINYAHLLAKISRQGLGQYALQTYTKIRGQLELRNMNLAESFRMFDLSGEGRLTRENLKSAFNHMQVTLTEQDLSSLMDDLDPAMNGRIPYADLVSKIRLPGTSAPGIPQGIRHPYLQELDKIKVYMKTNRKSVKEFFTLLDRDRNNAVSYIEFSTGLRQFGINIPDQEIRKITDELDPRNEGRITLTAFERLFADEVADEKFLVKQMDIVRGFLRTSRLDPRTVFSMYDQYTTGTVLKADFVTALERLSPAISRPDLEHLADLLSLKGDGKVDYEDFMKKLSEEPIESLNEKARNFIHSSGVSLATAFAQFDPGDQCITASQFRSVFDSIRLPLRPEELTRLIHDNQLFRTTDQRLSYRDFMERIGLREKPIQPKPKAVDIYARLRDAWRVSGANPQDVFRTYDYEGDQHLTVENLGKALAFSSNPLTREELEAVAGDVNKLPDGRVSTSHLIQKVLGQAAANPTNTVYAKIKVMVQEKRADLMRVMQQFDRDQDNALSYEEVGSALKSINILLSDQEFWTVFQDLDVRNERKVSLPEFVSRVGASNPPISRQDLTPYISQLNYIKTKLAEFKTAFNEHFKQPYRLEGSTVVSLNDFKDALSRLGMSMFAVETQNFVNLFIVKGQQKVDLTELEFAIRDLATLQTTQARPRYRVLSREDTEYVYQCLDYISDCIRDSRERPEDVVRRYDVNKNGSIEFSELRKLVNEELKIPSEEGVLGDIFLLLEIQGIIPGQRMVDVLTGVRVKQNVQGGATLSGPVPLDPIVTLRDHMRQRNMGLVHLLGRTSGTLPADAFKQALSNAGFNQPMNVLDLLVSRIATNLSQQMVSIEALEKLLAAADAGGIRTTQNDQVVTKLKAFMTGRNISIQQLIGRNSGTIEAEALLKALGNAGLTFTADERFVLGTVFGADTTGRTLSIDKINSALSSQAAPVYFKADPIPQTTQSTVPAPYNSRAGISRAFPTVPGNLQDALFAINSKLEQMGFSAEDAFSRFDVDRDGLISNQEFMQACVQIQAGLTPEIANQLFLSLDTNKSGSLSINEFARKLTGARVPERRLNVNVTEEMDKEIRALFDYFDIDKNGFIDQNEIRQALRAYGSSGTEKEMSDMITQMDKNRDGKIQYSEFREVMQAKVWAENTGKAQELSQLRQKFMEADYDQQGFLSPVQLGGVLQKMQIDVAPGDLQALITLADANKDGKIDIDEFMALMTTDDPNLLANPQAVAARFSINRARKLSPIDFLNMFAGVPKHFMQSFVTEEQRMGRLLPANEIMPILDRSGLTLKDVNAFPTEDRFRNVTYLRPNPVTSGGVVTIRMAKGVPIPDPTQVNYNSIIKRIVKVCLFDEKRTCFIGNSCFFEAAWRQQEQDVWNFELPTDRDGNLFAFRTNSDIDINAASLIFEFTIFIIRQQPVEMSCGFAKLPLNTLERTANVDLPIIGGSPVNALEISMSDVRVKRTGLKGLLLKTGSVIVRPTLTIAIRSYKRLGVQEVAELDPLPGCCVVRKKGVQLVKMYREALAKSTGGKSRDGFMTPTSTNSIVTYFPSVMNCPDVWIPLIDYWNSPELARTVNIRDEAVAMKHFTLLVSRLYNLLKTEEFGADESELFKFSFGMAGDLNNKRKAWANKALLGTSDARSELKYRPFTATELMPKTLLNLDQMMTRQLMSANRPRGGALSPGTPGQIAPQQMGASVGYGRNPIGSTMR